MRYMYKSGLIVIKDGHLLVDRKMNSDFYLLPGGRIEERETPEEALYREINEELSTTIVAGSLVYFDTFEDVAANEPDSIIQIQAYFGQLDSQPISASEIVEIYWFGTESDLMLLSPIIRNKVWPALSAAGYLPSLPRVF